MTVNFIKKPKQKTLSTFGKWYEANRKSYNESRASRYHNDPEYRQQVLDQARATRENRRKGAGKPEQYCWRLVDVAAELDVSLWTLRNWRINDYFPEPARYNSELWFTEQQVKLLQGIATYFATHKIRRLSAVQKIEMQEIVNGVHSTWSN